MCPASGVWTQPANRVGANPKGGADTIDLTHCDNQCSFVVGSDNPVRVLVVAHRTAATPLLLNAVRTRAARSPCFFTLLVPRPYWDPDTEEAEMTLEFALPLLEEAAGGHVEGLIGDSDPFVAVRDAVTARAPDEVIISTLPARVSRWLRRDLTRRVEQFGLPITVVTPHQSDRPRPAGAASANRAHLSRRIRAGPARRGRPLSSLAHGRRRDCSGGQTQLRVQRVLAGSEQAPARRRGG
jgi:hypothetical protein